MMITKRVKLKMLLDLEQVKENELLVEFLQGEIALIDKKNDTKRTKKEEQDTELIEKIKTIISNDYKCISDIVVSLNNEVTAQKVTAILTKLYKNGKIDKTVFKRINYYKMV